MPHSLNELLDLTFARETLILEVLFPLHWLPWVKLMDKNTRFDCRIIGYNLSSLGLIRNFQNNSAAGIVCEGARHSHEALGVQRQHVLTVITQRQLRNELSLWPSRAWPIDEKVCGLRDISWFRCDGSGLGEDAYCSYKSEQR